MDRGETLARLSDDDWLRPDSSSTQLYRDLCALRQLPVRELTPTSLHLLVTHQVGLDVTALLALEHVEADPLRSVALYPGDLLAALLRVDHSFWADHPALLDRMSGVLDRLRTLPDGDWQLLVTAADQFPG
ncbi:hypothetical protein BBK82_14195 [Lentzea guizhouensis]|uniref:Uncharacterized protein n=1 Tax=Lentzea guizhouensis TaxID=1586287 RepID=A0A1B2HH64_9PSEU|nr:contact-dependent growth inhibition system immunity protein [Lentzea guizhouensis]ANZ37048.1 hypothetical protein BBK82_14195 [Lentzea guizhouensis]